MIKMPRFPYFGFPNFYYRNYNYHPNYKNNKTNFNSSNFNHNTPPTSEKANYKKTDSKPNADSFVFDLFGLKLYFDDILLICLIFFLYNEGVKDEGLFFSLILLLLT